jgi:hypothetical protein
VGFHNVPYQGHHVALFIVEPPRWGDPIDCLEGEFDKYPAGRVFVRRMGSAHAASPGELKYLQERLLRRTDHIQVEVGWRETPAQVTPLEVGPAAVDQWISAERAALLAPLEQIRRQRSDPRRRQPGVLWSGEPAMASLSGSLRIWNSTKPPGKP